jgi:hypothetical protein
VGFETLDAVDDDATRRAACDATIIGVDARAWVGALTSDDENENDEDDDDRVC